MSVPCAFEKKGYEGVNFYRESHEMCLIGCCLCLVYTFLFFCLLYLFCSERCVLKFSVIGVPLFFLSFPVISAT